MAATLLLTSLVFAQYPHEKDKGKDSVFYIDGEAIYNLTDLRDSQYDGKVGHFTLDGKTYFTTVINSYDSSDTRSIRVYSPKDHAVYGTEDFKSVYEVKWSEANYDSLGYHMLSDYNIAPRYDVTGYMFIIFHVVPYEIAPDDPEVDLVKEQLADGTIEFSIVLPDATA